MFEQDAEWLNSHHPPDTRYQSAILTGENMASPAGIAALTALQARLRALRSEDGLTWHSQCKRVATPLTYETVSWVKCKRHPAQKYHRKL